MAAAPQISPQMLQALQAGGAPQAAPAAPPGGAPPAAAAAIGRMLQGQRQTPQGSGEMETKMIEQIMVQLGKVIQAVMLSNPKAYQHLLKAQMGLHSGVQELKSGAEDQQEHQQLTSSIMQLIGSQQGYGGTPTTPMGVASGRQV